MYAITTQAIGAGGASVPSEVLVLKVPRLPGPRDRWTADGPGRAIARVAGVVTVQGHSDDTNEPGASSREGDEKGDQTGNNKDKGKDEGKDQGNEGQFRVGRLSATQRRALLSGT